MTTIPEFLIRRLKQLGVDEGFGIVGDYALKLFDRLSHHGFPMLVTADEQGAAFAAEAYARLRGFGVCAVTYSVGGFKVVNATAGAWAENVPLLILSGAPGLAERKGDPLIHHKVKNFDTQLEVFKDVTIAQAVLTNPLTITEEIDRVIAKMIATQRPGYIEIPRDMVDVPVPDRDADLLIELPKVDPKRLELAVSETLELLAGNGAGDAVVIAGVMAVRRGLQKELLSFAENFEVPIATTSLSKGVIPETHPLALGVYMGAVSSEMVIQKVENAKPLISFGVLFSDIVMGGFTDHLDRGHVIECTDTHVNIGFHTYQDVPLWAFLPALIQAASDAGYRGYGQIAHKQYSFTAVQGKGLSVVRLMECVASFLDEKIRLIVDPGDCLFGSVELPAQSLMLASGYYATMGYAVPAALGAAKADPSLRPMVLVGDGAFLMTGLELLSATYHGVKPIVIVVDNEGYGTQRPMDDGPFNDIPALRSEELPRAFGVGVGLLCNSEDELHAALSRATQTEEFFIIRARVPKGQYSPGLIRLTSALKKRI
ncbi:thiamine pyrophosphate-binding protein [Methylophilaceae bacterium]|nr:thiamine pyrophosphate-binding protein [Methylophilaceae bacterium]